MAARNVVVPGRRQGKSAALAAAVNADLMLEKDIEKLCVDFLRRTGWFVFKIHQESRGKKYCHRGISDRIAVKNGRVLFLELKKSDGRQSEDQIKFEEDIKTHGGEYYLVRSLDDLVAIINAW